MKVWLIQDNEQIHARGISETEDYLAHYRQTVSPGGKLFGLTYEELKTLAWIESDDDGKLVGKGARNG